MIAARKAADLLSRLCVARKKWLIQLKSVIFRPDHIWCFQREISRSSYMKLSLSSLRYIAGSDRNKKRRNFVKLTERPIKYERMKNLVEVTGIQLNSTRDLWLIRYSSKISQRYQAEFLIRSYSTGRLVNSTKFFPRVTALSFSLIRFYISTDATVSFSLHYTEIMKTRAPNYSSRGKESSRGARNNKG